jgi:uncharacterized protein
MAVKRSPRYWINLAMFAAVVILVAAIGTVVKLAQMEAHNIVSNPIGARGLVQSSPADRGIADFESVTLTASDGIRLAAWVIPSQNGAAVILLHGYKGNRDQMLDDAGMLARHGYGSILIDMRGSGDSDGEKVTFGKMEVRDAETAYKYLLTRSDVDPERIGMTGNSMGGTVAILYGAENPHIKAVWSNSTFSSLQDEIVVGLKATAGLPPFPFAPMIQFFAEQETGLRASEVSAVAHIHEISPRPMMITQGGQDTQVPVDSGQKLYDAAGEPKELWFEPDLGHVELETMRAEEYERRMIAFYDHYLLGKTQP